MIHGWSANPRQTVPIAECFNEKGYWVSVPLLKGHGTKPEDLEDAKVEDWIEDTKRAVEELKNRPEIEKVFVGGISVGANLALIASTLISVEGIFLFGAPVHLKNHFLIKYAYFILLPLRKYIKKSYPKGLEDGKKSSNISYQYYPLVSTKEVLETIKTSNKSLKKVACPALIIQTSADYLVAKYSPWIIYNLIGAENKKMHWVRTGHANHILVGKEIKDTCDIIINFIEDVCNGKNNN